MNRRSFLRTMVAGALASLARFYPAEIPTAEAEFVGVDLGEGSSVTVLWEHGVVGVDPRCLCLGSGWGSEAIGALQRVVPWRGQQGLFDVPDRIVERGLGARVGMDRLVTKRDALGKR